MISTSQISRNFSISGCHFNNNEATTQGGAICFNAVMGNISHCEFNNNKCSNGCSIYYNCNGTPTKDEQVLTISDNKFKQTDSTKTGSLIYIDWKTKTNLKFRNNEITIGTDNTDTYLFGNAGTINITQLETSTNCISPSIEHICSNSFNFCESDTKHFEFDFYF